MEDMDYLALLHKELYETQKTLMDYGMDVDLDDADEDGHVYWSDIMDNMDQIEKFKIKQQLAQGKIMEDVQDRGMIEIQRLNEVNEIVINDLREVNERQHEVQRRNDDINENVIKDLRELNERQHEIQRRKDDINENVIKDLREVNETQHDEIESLKMLVMNLEARLQENEDKREKRPGRWARFRSRVRRFFHRRH